MELEDEVYYAALKEAVDQLRGAEVAPGLREAIDALLPLLDVVTQPMWLFGAKLLGDPWSDFGVVVAATMDEALTEASKSGVFSGMEERHGEVAVWPLIPRVPRFAETIRGERGHREFLIQRKEEA